MGCCSWHCPSSSFRPLGGMQQHDLNRPQDTAFAGASNLLPTWKVREMGALLQGFFSLVVAMSSTVPASDCSAAPGKRLTFHTSARFLASYLALPARVGKLCVLRPDVAQLKAVRSCTQHFMFTLPAAC